MAIDINVEHKMKIDGTCHCGNITYDAEIDPANVLVCHCTDCQTMSGSAFRTVVLVAEDKFNLQSGKLKSYIKTAESGNQREQTFCPECGSPLYSTSVGTGPRVLGLRLGTSRQRDQLQPRKQYWTRSAQQWTQNLGSVPNIEAQ